VPKGLIACPAPAPEVAGFGGCDRRFPTLTVIVDVDPAAPDLRDRMAALGAEVATVGGQLIASCQEPWLDAPAGVEVAVFPSSGKADRLDAASAVATGDLLAFVDRRAHVPAGWAKTVIAGFDDANVTVVGGPVSVGAGRMSERVGALIMGHYLRSSPAAHNNRKISKRRQVREVGSSNLVIRADAFRAVGGFQAPGETGGDSVRLCYKVRSILGGNVVADPRLAVHASAPAFPGELLKDIAYYGKCRGDLARRLPEAAPLVPFALPTGAVLALVAAIAGVLAVGGGWDLLWAAVAAAGAVSLAALGAAARGGRCRFADRLLACLALPMVIATFGVMFVNGYLGRSLEEVSPPRERESPLRVLILNWRDVTHPWSGGAETYMHEIARRWAADGIDVAWLTQRHPGSPRHQVIDRIHVRRVGGRVTMYPRAAISYMTLLRNRYDVIIDCENGIPFFAPLYSRVPTVLVVHHVHQEIFRNQVPRQLRWLALWLEGWLMPRVYRRCQVVAVSDDTRSDLIDLGFDSGRISIIRNGVVPSRDAGSRPGDDPSILCMGRLKPQKSVDVLIRALPAVVEKFPGLRLDVVGQGPDRYRLERLAWTTGMAAHVRFHGYVRSQVRDALSAAAWVAVCPSSFEGWGVVCMEASARGLPVIASNVPGLRESVRDGETGLLVPHGDEGALADALVALLEAPEMRRAMGDAGKRWAARHTWDDSAARFANLLNEVIISKETIGAPSLVAASATGRQY
jgi:glycosyltransferase involved in cell wall biosynthesis